jgi:hypothetical protein
MVPFSQLSSEIFQFRESGHISIDLQLAKMLFSRLLSNGLGAVQQQGRYNDEIPRRQK